MFVCGLFALLTSLLIDAVSHFKFCCALFTFATAVSTVLLVEKGEAKIGPKSFLIRAGFTSPFLILGAGVKGIPSDRIFGLQLSLGHRCFP
jgi:hypothetical protein